MGQTWQMFNLRAYEAFVYGHKKKPEADDKVTVICHCGQTVKHEQWCWAVPKLAMPRPVEATDENALGWHVISGVHLLEALRRCAAEGNADAVFAELWANAEHEDVP